MATGEPTGLVAPPPESCPGTGGENAGKASACNGCPNQSVCSTGAAKPVSQDPDIPLITKRLENVKHKILVLSGKGGVGKSTFSAQLSFGLAARFKEVGLLDIDICGPSIPKMMGLEGEEIHQSNSGWSPVYVEENLGVMSIAFMLGDADDPVIWRGPRKNGLVKQFLRDVDWGHQDFLVVDTPPGTSDEHISIAQYLKATNPDGAIIVTTPQQVSIIDVRKEINFCKKVGLPVLGVVENMSELRTPLQKMRFSHRPDGAAAAKDVTERVMAAIEAAMPGLGAQLLAATEVLPAGAGGGAVRAMCKSMEVPYLGAIPLDPGLAAACDKGQSIHEASGGEAKAAIQVLIDNLLATLAGKP
mmetsp:Transcript_37963/g.97157  ORF Transcript_37963/g.97157 Transcript_37963/m.97157 type:complete len:359 (-) Transcript_37963:10-1086(-)